GWHEWPAALRRHEEDREHPGGQEGEEHERAELSAESEQLGNEESETEAEQHGRRHEIDVRSVADHVRAEESKTEHDEEHRAGMLVAERQQEIGDADGDENGAAKHTPRPRGGVHGGLV